MKAEKTIIYFKISNITALQFSSLLDSGMEKMIKWKSTKKPQRAWHTVMIHIRVPGDVHYKPAFILMPR